ncbi:DUF2065 domain-containing protein [Desulfobacterium sp. N47]|uniref:Uncharacterized protein n=1 Tax=uncultured Desulfobacterium sp. TaxID=201089 RepID=E1YFS8_9BACT|nr:unknown protein [uncultured Desulfobacterium sp.]
MESISQKKQLNHQFKFRGPLYFAFPEKMKQWIIKILGMDEGSLRWMGLFLSGGNRRVFVIRL